MSEDTDLTLGHLKRRLGGSIVSGRLRFPGIGRPESDRSVSITIDKGARGGYKLKCFRPADDWKKHRDFVDKRAGLDSGRWSASRESTQRDEASAPSPAPALSGVDVPDMTPVKPGERGKRVQAIGRSEPPPVNGELRGRRHAYRRDGKAIRFKIKKTEGAPWIDFYRVRVPKTGREGWQAQRPRGFVPMPYVGAVDPFDAEVVADTAFWAEGEKDVDTLGRLGLPAFTFGSATDVPKGCGALLRGRDIVILSDNDGSGRLGVSKKLKALDGFAARVRVDGFTDMKEGQDVTDWVEAGGTRETLLQRVEDLPSVEMAVGGLDMAREGATWEGAVPEAAAWEGDAMEGSAVEAPPRPRVTATPFLWIDPATIPPRAWVYGDHLIQRFISTTIAPGGVGKSMLGIVEALAIATGRPLLGVKPVERARVWYWNGEDPVEELDRRIMAACLHYDITKEEIEGWLYVDSGRVTPICVAIQARTETKIAFPVVQDIKETIRAFGIKVLIVDPFVSCHEVQENDNGAIHSVVTVWAQVADETDCAVDLVHHARKGQGGEVTVEDARGASALLGKARAARTLNVMTEKEAEAADVDIAHRRFYFRTYGGKANLAPPSDRSDWYRLASMDLGNGTADRPSDSVGVATVWKWPSAFDGVTVADLVAVQHRVNGGRYRESSQADEWVGYVVAEILHLDADKKADNARIKALLKTWFGNGMLQVVEGRDDKGNTRKFVAVDKWAK